MYRFTTKQATHEVPRHESEFAALVPFRAETLFVKMAGAWRGYVFAAAVSVIAFLLSGWVGKFAVPNISPFLYGFAAVTVVVAGTGAGPGVLAAAISAAWCAVTLASLPGYSVGNSILQSAMFLAATLLSNICFARLHRGVRKATRGENWHRSLIETSAEGIWTVDETGLIVYANPRIAEILGINSRDLQGRKVEDFLFPSELHGERVRFQSRRQGHKDQFDRRLRRSDGQEVWVLACSTAFPGTSNSEGVLSMMTDITERKLAEQSLRRSERRFRSLFENVLEGVYQTTAAGRILAANPMLLKMLGLSGEAELDALIANDLYVDPNVRRRLTSRLEQEGSFQNVAYELRRRDGKVITVQENARAVRDEDGQLLYYEGTLIDVTETRKKEVQLREAHQTAALCDLASATARDFTTLLAGIAGQAEAMAVSPLLGARERAGDILRSVERASALAGQLVSFSRRYSAAPCTVDLIRVLKDCEGVLRQIAAGRVELVMNVDPTTSEATPVHMDLAHVEYIALNLMLNAAETMQPGSAVEVRTEIAEFGSAFSARQAPGQAEARFGVFVAITVIGHGWEPLRGRPRAADESPAGQVVTQVAAQYGGFTAIESLPDGRTSFSVFLPKASVAALRTSSLETILLVDDESMVRELTLELLEAEGYRVLAAGSAREAEALEAQGLHFDLLLTDVVMPDVSGPMLAQRLREARPGLKVLFISGYANQQLKVGENNFLSKPFAPDALAIKVREILDGMLA